jgi:hypothetical protein
MFPVYWEVNITNESYSTNLVAVYTVKVCNTRSNKQSPSDFRFFEVETVGKSHCNIYIFSKNVQSYSQNGKETMKLSKTKSIRLQMIEPSDSHLKDQEFVSSLYNKTTYSD